MNIQNVTDKIDHLTNEWEEFVTKDTTNSKIAELEIKLSNIQASLDMPAIDVHSIETKSAFGKYLRNGDTRLLETKSLSSVSPDEGGYLITPSLHKKINTSILAKSPIRQLASIDTISTNALDVIIQDGNFDSGWVSELDKRDTTNSPKLQQKRIMVHELYAQPKATQKLLDDSAIDLEEWLTTQLQDSFVKAENKSFISGNGTNQPKGILSYDSGSIDRLKVASAGKIALEDILKLINSLDEQYLANAAILTHRSTLSEIQKLKDTNGRFLWQPSLSQHTPDTLFGIPILCSGDIPNFAPNSEGLILAGSVASSLSRHF